MYVDIPAPWFASGVDQPTQNALYQIPDSEGIPSCKWGKPMRQAANVATGVVRPEMSPFCGLILGCAIRIDVCKQ